MKDNQNDQAQMSSNASFTTQTTPAPLSSAVLAIFSMILAAVSLIPFLGIISILSIILAIGSFIRKERKLMGFLALIFGLIGLATSPLVWGSIIIYIECKLHGCPTIEQSTDQGTSQMFTPTFSTTSPSTSTIYKYNIEDTSTTELPNLYYYLYILPSLPRTTNLDNVAMKLCDNSRTYNNCTVYFWDSPDMLNYSFTGTMPNNLITSQLYNLKCQGGNCNSYWGIGNWPDTVDATTYPVQTVTRKQLQPGIQYIGGEFKDTPKETLYLSYPSINNIQVKPTIYDIQAYANQQSNVVAMYFYQTSQDAKNHAKNYQYSCTIDENSSLSCQTH